jgi:hypothetical protein
MTEFHDFDMRIEVSRRWTIVQWKHEVNARRGRDKLHEFGLRPKTHVRRGRAQWPRETEELNGVAQAMIAAYQHMLVRERTAVPDPL